jgi:gliding motility-associated-like protein
LVGFHSMRQTNIISSLLRKFVLPVFAIFATHINAQTTNTCVEIESILVDACAPIGGEEKENEMMRFLIGPNPQNIASLSISFGFGQPFSGIIFPNGTTAAKVAALNATIQSCGLLKEPLNGILPANSKVLFVTSVNVNVNSNPFTNLADTLYMIFQNTNFSSNAFFINYAASGTTIAPDLQSTSISFGLGCSDQVTYNRTLLTRQNGTIGAQDGATVNFSFQGTPTYVNNGCQAPFEPLSAAWNAPASVCQTAAPINLSALITGSTGGSFTGTGVNGSSFNPAGLQGTITITYQVQRGSCSLQESKTIQVFPQASAAWNAPSEVCSGGQPLDLNNLITGSSGGVFSGSGVIGSLFNPAGLSGPVQISYAVGAPGCSDQQSKTINVINVPAAQVSGITTWCANETVPVLEVTNAGNNTIRWYADPGLNNLVFTGSSYTPPSQSGEYYAVSGNGTCNASPTLVTLNVKEVPSIPSADTLVFYCENQNIPSIEVNGSGVFNWYRDQELQNLVFTGSPFQPVDTSIQFYWVNATADGCTSAALRIRLNKILLQDVSISLSGPQPICAGDSVILTSSSPINNTWSTGETSRSIVVKNPGNISLTVNSVCGSGTDQVTIEARPVSTSLVASTDTSEIPFQLVLNATSENEDECLWFRDGQPIEYASGTALQVTEAGTYVYLISCNNTAGCSDSDSVVVVATSNKIELVIPNVFTPDGDGINDLFNFQISGYERTSGLIFNRWGKKVFEWDGLQPDWDGQINGKDAAQGVYFYIFTGMDLKGLESKQNGTVTLLRK